MNTQTGEIPIAAFVGDEDAPLDNLGWSHEINLWAGCIDAPEWIPAGGTCSGRHLQTPMSLLSLRSEP